MFLIDTGADISVIPPSSHEKHYFSDDLPLFSANGSKIKTFGNKNLTLNLELLQPFQWNFVIADVTQPIIGSDILKTLNVLVDVKNNKLVTHN